MFTYERATGQMKEGRSERTNDEKGNNAHETWKSSHAVVMKYSFSDIKLKFGVLVFVKGGKPTNPMKNSRNKDEN